MLQDTSSNNKRIAKNTLLLYIRTFFTMIVGLYTSRIMLDALGVEDYGVSNVVGGIVSFSSLLTATMAASSSRYLTYSLGEGILEKQKNVFVTTINVQLAMAFIAFVFLEIAGVWFLNNVAEIPQDRIGAANWVLQCAVISTFFSLASTPFISLVIAHERMEIYAYMSIFEVFAKLSVCFFISSYAGDRLILYSILLLLSSLSANFIYALFCYRNFEEVEYQCKIDRSLFKDMAGYSGWNMFSNTTWMLNTQGVNMLINIFFGVAFNATRGIATTVNGAVQNFVSSFTTAFTPQITKSYAAANYDYCYLMVNKGAKYTCFLILVFLLPISMETEFILRLWLVEIPPMLVLFVRLSLLESFALQSSSTLLTLIQATGNVRNYAINVSIYTSMVFPLTWICYSLNAPIWISYPIFILFYFSVIIFRFKTLNKLTTYQWQSFVKEVLYPVTKVFFSSWIIPLLVAFILPSSVIRFFVLISVSVFSVVFSIYVWGLNKNERVVLKEFIIKFVQKVYKA